MDMFEECKNFFLAWEREKKAKREIRRENNEINMRQNRKMKEYETELSNPLISHVISKIVFRPIHFINY
jgi:hypothetical protein